MADIARVAARVRPMEVIEARLVPMIADESIKRGQSVYRKANGRAGLAKGDAVATAKIVGLATTDCEPGFAFEAEHYGLMAGFDLSKAAPGTTVYLSTATSGAIADTKPTTGVVFPIGTVHTLTDPSFTKVLFIDVPQNTDPVAI